MFRRGIVSPSQSLRKMKAKLLTITKAPHHDFCLICGSLLFSGTARPLLLYMEMHMYMKIGTTTQDDEVQCT